MDDYAKKAIDIVFGERKDFIIIGLTGRTGNGCSTIANLLTKSFLELEIPIPIHSNEMSEDDRKKEIIYHYAEKNWQPFIKIEVKYIIFTFLLEHPFDRLRDFLNQNDKWEEFSRIVKEKKIKDLENRFNELHNKRLEFKKILEENKMKEYISDIYNFYFIKIHGLFDEIADILIRINFYTLSMQTWGDNIRKYNSSYEEIEEDLKINNYILVQRINTMIKILRTKNLTEKGSVLVVIDALRNPFEVSFFKDRYSSFYVLGVTCNEKVRNQRLFNKGLTVDKVEELKNREYPSLTSPGLSDDEFFYKINVEGTMSLADIYIVNEGVDNKLYSVKEELIKYVSLMMHPGLVQPSKIEYCMQMANDSKLNSGCLSRQVGAVVTDDQFNIIATGWNNVPDKQISCSLRSICSLVNDSSVDSNGLSSFEKYNEEFRGYAKTCIKSIDLNELRGLPSPYCFKDIYNGFQSNKNQVHTRSIHAEEMAFLQSGKIGAPNPNGGFLFTTASPCELCAKKAYHLGIKVIYYIDLYPGISYDHILNTGDQIPKMIQFSGAIGRAYQQLYTPILPFKDELKMRLKWNFKRK